MQKYKNTLLSFQIFLDIALNTSASLAAILIHLKIEIVMNYAALVYSQSMSDN